MNSIYPTASRLQVVTVTQQYVWQMKFRNVDKFKEIF